MRLVEEKYIFFGVLYVFEIPHETDSVVDDVVVVADYYLAAFREVQSKLIRADIVLGGGFYNPVDSEHRVFIEKKLVKCGKLSLTIGDVRFPEVLRGAVGFVAVSAVHLYVLRF